MAIEVVLNNRTAELLVDPILHRKLREYWSFYKPGYLWTPSYKLWTRLKHQAKMNGDPDREVAGWDGKIRFLQHSKMPAGLFRALRKETEQELGLQFEVTYDLPSIKFLPGFAEENGKYGFQNEAVDLMMKATRRGGGIVLSATGTGKTKLCAQYFSKLSCPCLFVVDQLDLLYQSQKEISSWLKELVGVVGDSEFQIGRVTVGTVQTLARHLKTPEFERWYDAVEVVVVDELHTQLNHSNFKVLETIKPIARFGLTATLQLQKKDVRMRAHAFAGPVIFEFPVQEGISSGVLSKGRVLQLLFPEVEPGLTDFQEEYKIEVVENEVKRNAASLLIPRLIEEDRYVVALMDRVKHVEDLSEKLIQIPHRLAYGKIDRLSRFAAIEKFEAGSIRLILSSVVFKKGINLKRVDVILDLAEMYSKNDALQKFGRGVRLHPDKTELLHIDFGSQGGRFHRNARSRSNAFKSSGIPIRTVKVTTPQDALREVRKEIVKMTVKGSTGVAKGLGGS